MKKETTINHIETLSYGDFKIELLISNKRVCIFSINGEVLEDRVPIYIGENIGYFHDARTHGLCIYEKTIVKTIILDKYASFDAENKYVLTVDDGTIIIEIETNPITISVKDYS